MGAFGSRSGGSTGVGVTGMLEYAAPERFRARAGSASIDQYSLAVVTYQCLSGTLPFVGDAPEEIERLHRSERPPSLAETRGDIPPNVDQAIQRAMSKAIVDRFPNVLDFVSMLRGDWASAAPQVVVPEESTASPQLVLVEQPGADDDDDDPSFRPVVQQRSSRWRQLAFIAIGVILAESAWLWFRSSRAEPEPEFVTNTPAVTVRQTPPIRDSVPIRERQPTGLPEQVRREQQDDRRESPTALPAGDAAPRVTERAGADSVRPAATVSEPARQPAAQPPPVAVPLRRDPFAAEPGLLAINATPWGQLFIDGRLIGNTPLRDLLLSPGTHVIRVVRRGFVPFEIEVDVAPGQQLRLTNIVLEPEPR
jgi:serine/threonine-protein kinase